MHRRVSRIPSDHPLRLMFQDLVHKHLKVRTGLHDAEIEEYVSGVLTDFSDVNNLHPLWNASGRRLDEVAELLIESNPLLDAPSFDREREVRKHVGDLTLFLTGLFPESVAAIPIRHPLSLDTFVDYVAAGKESYGVVAAFNVFEYRDEAPLFRRLSDSFEQCVSGLNLVKQELAHLPRGRFYRPDRWGG